MIRCILALALVLPAAGCYSMALDEFDSVAGWEDGGREPEELSYTDTPLQYPFFGRIFGLGPGAAPVDNPSGFARERMAQLIQGVGDDLPRMAQLCRRLMWVMSKDPNPFNRIVAMQGIEKILARLGLDPLDPAAYVEETSRAEGARLERRILAVRQRIGRLLERPDRPSLSDEQRQVYLDGLAVFDAHPRPQPIWQRNLILSAWVIQAEETDDAVVAAARGVMRRAIQFAACNSLRAALVPQSLDAVDYPAVRAEALNIYRRLGGIPAVPFVLKLMARPKLGTDKHAYDEDPRVRMILIRLCAQLEYRHAIKGSDGGPAPIEFLFETAVDEEEEEGRRRMALEGLSRCLSAKTGRRRISLDPAWAKSWWSEYIGAGRKGP